MVTGERNRIVGIGLLAVCCLIFLPGLSATDLWDEDEGFYVSAAQEMFCRGEWIVPYFNGQLFGHKPPWMYWMMILGFQALGVSELAARLPAALFSIGSIFLTVQIGRRMFKPSVGWLAGFILATSLFFTVTGRSATADPFLVFFTTAAMMLFVQYHWGNAVTNSAPQDGLGWKWLPSNWSLSATMIGIYFLLALGVLVKGPIAVLFPLTVMGMFLFQFHLLKKGETRQNPSTKGRRAGGVHHFLLSLVRAVAQLQPLTCVIVLSLVAAPWFLMVGWKTNGEFLREFFGVHHFQRATTSMEGHQGNAIFYYPASLLIGMFPWTVFTVPALIVCWRGLQQSASDHRGLLLLIIWALVYTVVFSAAATKLPNYILPIYPAIAILFSYTIDHWMNKTVRYHAVWYRGSMMTLIGCGLLMVGAVPTIQAIPVDGGTLIDQIGMSNSLQAELFRLGGLGIPIILGGIVSWILIERQRGRFALISFIITATIFLMLVWNVAAPWANQFQSSKRLVSRLYTNDSIDMASSTRHDLSDGRALAAYYYFRPSIVFYHRQPITRCWDRSQVVEFWQAHPKGAMIVEADRFVEIETAIAIPLRIISQISRFPEKGELLLVEQAN